MTPKEYKEKLKQLLDKIVMVDVTTCETEPFVWATYSKNRVCQFEICCVNGIKYMVFKDYCLCSTNRKDTFIANGVLQPSDFIYFRRTNNRGLVTCFVKVDALYENREKITELSVEAYHTEKSIIPIAMAAKKAVVPNVEIDEDVLARSEAARQERLSIMAEQRKLNMKERKELLQKIELKLENNTDNANERLQELVKEIESMGWAVTLKLKENG